MFNYFLKNLILLLFFANFTIAQTNNLKIQLPSKKNWNIGLEGQNFLFKLNGLSDSLNPEVKFDFQQGKQIGMNLDSIGFFSWTPGYNLVNRIEEEKLYQFIVEANSKTEGKTTAIIELKVKNVNRSPVITELLPFYIKYNTTNSYKIKPEEAFDEDNDPIVFIPFLETLPEGMTLTSNGEINWKPSFNQFRVIKEKPIYIEFHVQDQPNKSQVKGKLKVEVTQMDLPPQIISIPKNEYLKIKENENIDIKFYLSDPNGDEDIEVFDFLSNQTGLPKNLLTKNSNNQYEFIWLPGYDYVQDPKDSVNFYIDFFALDKSQKREVKRINFSILNSINEAETDKKNYILYFGTLTRVWEILEQLKEKEEELKKAYNKARKGKKSRSVVNASLGATTGFSSILSKNKPDVQRAISTIGGTTVLTIGTLEATEVIGKSMKDLIDRLNYVIEKKNELQTKGDILSRDFSLKAARRTPEFIKKVDEFMTMMNLKGLVALELNATWESKNKPTESNVKKTFKDFNVW